MAREEQTSIKEYPYAVALKDATSETRFIAVVKNAYMAEIMVKALNESIFFKDSYKYEMVTRLSDSDTDPNDIEGKPI